MRNSPSGMIWQSYSIENEIEKKILTRNATNNGFFVEVERENATSTVDDRYSVI